MIVKSYLKDNAKFKIKLCVIGANRSGKTSLIKSYLKYKNDALKKLLQESEAQAAASDTFGHHSDHTDILPKSHRSFNSSTSNLTLQIRYKLREMERLKNCSISDRGGTGNIVNKGLQDTDIEHVLYLYDEDMPIEIQLWDQVKGQCTDAASHYFFS